MLVRNGCHVVTGAARRARLEVPDNSIGKSVLRLQSADARVIIVFGGLRRDNIGGIPTPQPPQSRPTEPVCGFDKQFPIVRAGPPTDAPCSRPELTPTVSESDYPYIFSLYI